MNEAGRDVSARSLSTSAPHNTVAFAEEVARKHYKIIGAATLLACERDQIFALKDADGERYVMRFTNPSEDRQVSNFQTEAMLHVAYVAPDYPVPRIIRSVNDEAEVLVVMADGQTSLVRMITFLPGVPMASVPDRSAQQRRNMGRCLAQLDLALRGFFHPAAGHELLWDLKRAANLRDLLPHISDTAGRKLATSALDDFERFALPQLPKLRGQVIHNDLNFSNVMVDESDHAEITGILDFGDMVYGPLINELGVACSYQLSDSDDPLATVAEFLGAYHQTLPLEPAELDILFDLIRARLVMTVCITEWRAALYPENRDYILRNNPGAWRGLNRLAPIGRDSGRAYLRDACGV